MNSVANLSEHEIFELLKLQDDLAWRLVWEKAVLAEAKSLRSARMAREWGVTPEELMGILYEDMIAKRKIELFRDDGGSLWGWLRQYVRGYIRRANPAARGEISIDAADEAGFGDDEGGTSYTDKISKMLSDAQGRESLPTEDPAMRRREEWELVQTCFGDLCRHQLGGERGPVVLPRAERHEKVEG